MDGVVAEGRSRWRTKLRYEAEGGRTRHGQLTQLEAAAMHGVYGGRAVQRGHSVTLNTSSESSGHVESGESMHGSVGVNHCDVSEHAGRIGAAAHGVP